MNLYGRERDNMMHHAYTDYQGMTKLSLAEVILHAGCCMSVLVGRGGRGRGGGTGVPGWLQPALGAGGAAG